MKKLDILFIIDPFAQMHVDVDLSLAIMREANLRGHRAWICHLEDLSADQSGAHVKASRATPKAASPYGWDIRTPRICALNDFPIVFMRKDPPFSIEYVMASSILSLADPVHAFVVNNPTALRTFNEKMGILQFPEFIPETLVSKDANDIVQFLRKHKKIVLKPLETSSGQDIVILDSKDRNRDSLIDMLTQREHRYIAAQRYLPAIAKGDKRIYLLDGKVAGMYLRHAPSHDHRSNLYAGGYATPTTATPAEYEMCEQVGAQLQTMGIYFAGIDVIGGLITEINVTSPGIGFKGMKPYRGTTLAHKLIDFLESHAPHN